MNAWPDRRLLELLGVELPIIQAPMAGSDSVSLARSVSSAGALGSLAAALLDASGVHEAASALGAETDRPFNLNFFCHAMPAVDDDAAARWTAVLAPHYAGLGLEVAAVPASRLRLPFDAAMCDVVEEVRPRVVSFHFGLPDAELVRRLKRCGVRIVSSATSVREARWLEARGCDAVIAQGIEAGGHRAMFLETDVASQVGLFALLPQIADAVAIPVIAAGGIADARGIAAAFALGASGVQLGTAYLACPEAAVPDAYRRALGETVDTSTVVTNVFSGRPARGIANRYVREVGPLASDALAFPHASRMVGPLRAASEAGGSPDYLQLWAGQSAPLARAMPAAHLTRTLAVETLELLRRA